ncbi:hypothetical protein AB834_05540 [PVC group bacterium (ex Bugula neritina AB1)]|nr:hypothetical protein AB834_05540 [PVC group bacterium (ex Bugula neritina AB1)]
MFKKITAILTSLFLLSSNKVFTLSPRSSFSTEDPSDQIIEGFITKAGITFSKTTNILPFTELSSRRKYDLFNKYEDKILKEENPKITNILDEHKTDSRYSNIKRSTAHDEHFFRGNFWHASHVEQYNKEESLFQDQPKMPFVASQAPLLKSFHNITDNTYFSDKTNPNDSKAKPIPPKSLLVLQKDTTLNYKVKKRETVSHFWINVFLQKKVDGKVFSDIDTIVQLTNVNNDVKHNKVSPYFTKLGTKLTIHIPQRKAQMKSSEQEDSLSKLEVEMISEESDGDTVKRVFRLTPNDDTSKVKTVTHFHYTTWPDHQIPESTESFQNLFFNYLKHESKVKQRSTLVHCSAGIGRTGVFIALKSIFDEYLKHLKYRPEEPFDFFDVVEKVVKHHREVRDFVQTGKQYVFLHEVALSILNRTRELAHKKTGTSEETDPVYENVEFGKTQTVTTDPLYENVAFGDKTQTVTVESDNTDPLYENATFTQLVQPENPLGIFISTLSKKHKATFPLDTFSYESTLRTALQSPTRPTFDKNIFPLFYEKTLTLLQNNNLSLETLNYIHECVDENLLRKEDLMIALELLYKNTAKNILEKIFAEYSYESVSIFKDLHSYQDESRKELNHLLETKLTKLLTKEGYLGLYQTTKALVAVEGFLAKISLNQLKLKRAMDFKARCYLNPSLSEEEKEKVLSPFSSLDKNDITIYNPPLDILETFTGDTSESYDRYQKLFDENIAVSVLLGNKTTDLSDQKNLDLTKAGQKSLRVQQSSAKMITPYHFVRYITIFQKSEADSSETIGIPKIIQEHIFLTLESGFSLDANKENLLSFHLNLKKAQALNCDGNFQKKGKCLLFASKKNPLLPYFKTADDTLNQLLFMRKDTFLKNIGIQKRDLQPLPISRIWAKHEDPTFSQTDAPLKMFLDHATNFMQKVSQKSYENQNKRKFTFPLSNTAIKQIQNNPLIQSNGYISRNINPMMGEPSSDQPSEDFPLLEGDKVVGLSLKSNSKKMLEKALPKEFLVRFEAYGISFNKVNNTSWSISKKGSENQMGSKPELLAIEGDLVYQYQENPSTFVFVSTPPSGEIFAKKLVFDGKEKKPSVSNFQPYETLDKKNLPDIMRESKYDAVTCSSFWIPSLYSSEPGDQFKEIIVEPRLDLNFLTKSKKLSQTQSIPETQSTSQGQPNPTFPKEGDSVPLGTPHVKGSKKFKDMFFKVDTDPNDQSKYILLFAKKVNKVNIGDRFIGVTDGSFQTVVDYVSFPKNQSVFLGEILDYFSFPNGLSYTQKNSEENSDLKIFTIYDSLGNKIKELKGKKLSFVNSSTHKRSLLRCEGNGSDTYYNIDKNTINLNKTFKISSSFTIVPSVSSWACFPKDDILKALMNERNFVKSMPFEYQNIAKKVENYETVVKTPFKKPISIDAKSAIRIRNRIEKFFDSDRSHLSLPSYEINYVERNADDTNDLITCKQGNLEDPIIMEVSLPSLSSLDHFSPSHLEFFISLYAFQALAATAMKFSADRQEIVLLRSLLKTMRVANLSDSKTLQTFSIKDFKRATTRILDESVLPEQKEDIELIIDTIFEAAQKPEVTISEVLIGLETKFSGSKKIFNLEVLKIFMTSA